MQTSEELRQLSTRFEKGAITAKDLARKLLLLASREGDANLHREIVAAADWAEVFASPAKPKRHDGADKVRLMLLPWRSRRISLLGPPFSRPHCGLGEHYPQNPVDIGDLV